MKRIDSYLWKNHGFSFSERSNILNDIYTNCTKEEVAFDLYGRFDASFNWTPGDFGDGRSCFWLSHAIARYYMKEWKEAHGYTLFQTIENPNHKIKERRYHKSPMQQGDAWYLGYGRCWTLINYPIPDVIVVFNAYPGEHLLHTFASSIITGIAESNPELGSKLLTKNVKMKNSGSQHNWFYTNGQTALVIGTEASLKKLPDNIDIKKEKPDYNSLQDFGGECIFGCGRYAWKDRPSIFDIDSKKNRLGVCEQCVYKKSGQIFVSCGICGADTFYMKEHERFDVCGKRVTKHSGGELVACPACHDTLDLARYTSGYTAKAGDKLTHLREREEFDMKYAPDAIAQMGG